MGGVWVCPMPDASLDYRTVTQWAESVSGWGCESDTRGGVLRRGWGLGVWATGVQRHTARSRLLPIQSEWEWGWRGECRGGGGGR